MNPSNSSGQVPSATLGTSRTATILEANLTVSKGIGSSFYTPQTDRKKLDVSPDPSYNTKVRFKYWGVLSQGFGF